MKEKIVNATCLVVFAFAVSACRYPMGLSKQQWLALSPAQQAEYQSQQYRIDEERRRAWAAQQAAEERRAAELRRIDQEKTRAAYANARYRDIITVLFSSGEVFFNKKSSTIEPVAVDFVRGETRVLQFTGLNGSQFSLTARFSEDGNNFYLGTYPRERLVFINQGWESGKSYLINNDAPWFRARNLKFQIKFKQLAGSPQRNFH